MATCQRRLWPSRRAARPPAPSASASEPYPKTNWSTSAALLARLVLERDREPDAVLLDLPVLDRDVLPDHLGDPQVADALGGGLDGIGRSLCPPIRTGPDHLGDAVHTACHTSPPLRSCRTSLMLAGAKPP